MTFRTSCLTPALKSSHSHSKAKTIRACFCTYISRPFSCPMHLLHLTDSPFGLSACSLQLPFWSLVSARQQYNESTQSNSLLCLMRLSFDSLILINLFSREEFSYCAVLVVKFVTHFVSTDFFATPSTNTSHKQFESNPQK